MELLSVEDITVRFGGIVAVQDATFGITEGEIVGLIGPNGAGKTTLFNVITRFYTPTAGDVKFRGRSIIQARPHDIVGLGIARTFQNVELFRTMTVLDNVLVGNHVHVRATWPAAAVRAPSVRRAERDARATAMRALDQVGLAGIAARPVAGLPFGSLKRVELARALVSRPSLLLLDEPAGGLNHQEVGELGTLIRRIHAENDVTILLVEHHMNLVMGVCDRVVVLNFGKRIAIGTPAEVRADPAVIEAYLGGRTVALLELDNVTASYGPIKALHGVSLKVEAGEIVALLGANGAGKTTTLRAISGTVSSGGGIRFDGHSIHGAAAHDTARRGVGHVPEGRGTMVQLSVWDNLRMGAYTRRDADRVTQDYELIFGYFPILRERRAQAAGTLSGGEQQMLAIARALMARPQLLLLDEPSLGLAPLVVRSIFEIITSINRDEGVAVLLVEQNATLALGIAHRAYLLETGQVVAGGDAAELASDESIRRSYLGY